MKRWIGILFLLLICCPVLAQDDREIRQLNERLEKNKAEILREIDNIQNENEKAIAESIDSNFKVLDDRLNQFFKSATRDVAIIMVAGFLVGFTISQVVKIKVEQMRRRALVKQAFELETKVQGLTTEALRLNKVVRELKSMDKKNSGKLKSYKPQKFFNFRSVIFAGVTFVLGAGLMYLVVS
jgi:hypothetical protein